MQARRARPTGLAPRPTVVLTRRVGAALGSAALLALLLARTLLAAEASPVLIDPLDPRAEGEGPGLVGDPLLAAVVVLALGLLAAVATAVYVRLVRRA